MFILLVFVFYDCRSACAGVVCQMSYILERGWLAGEVEERLFDWFANFLLGFLFWGSGITYVCFIFIFPLLLSLWVNTITGGETQSIMFVVCHKLSQVVIEVCCH